MEAVAPEDAVFQRCNGPDATEEELEEQLAFFFFKMLAEAFVLG